MSITDIRTEKKRLRAKHKKIRLSLTKQKKALLDSQITSRFLNSDIYKNAEKLFIYVSTDIEVDTRKIIQKAFEDNKKVAVPKCVPNSALMDFYFIRSFDDLDYGSYSILEPIKSKCEIVKENFDGVCIVPALSYDEEGFRLGFGKGYYDRFLQSFYGITVGLSYSKCIEKKLPKGNFDIPVNMVITEKYTNNTKNVFGKGMI